MEAQICNLLMQFCNRRLELAYNELNTKTLISGIQFRTIDETKHEPWLDVSYANPYYKTLKEAVLVLRKLYMYW